MPLTVQTGGVDDENVTVPPGAVAVTVNVPAPPATNVGDAGVIVIGIGEIACCAFAAWTERTRSAAAL